MTDRASLATHKSTKSEKKFAIRAGIKALWDQGKQAAHDGGAEVSLATRAAWLSYIGGLTQEEIAGRLGVSRVKVNRLVALAHKKGMVRTFVDGHIVECVELEEALKARFGLTFCEVVPALEPTSLPLAELAAGGARLLMRILAKPELEVVGVGHGRTLAAIVDTLPSLPRSHVQFVSLLGCLTRNALANPFDVIHRLANKTGSESFFMPVPFAADTPAAKAVLMDQQSVRNVFDLARLADVSLVGIGELSERAHLVDTGMITSTEHRELVDAGAVGEVLGQFLNGLGQPVDLDINARTLGLRLDDLAGREVVAVAGGAGKARAITAVLNSGGLSGLVTDEATAQRIMQQPGLARMGELSDTAGQVQSTTGGS